MNCYFLYNNKKFEIIGANTLSTGDGLDLSQRYGYDYSNTPQSLVFRRKNTALTATIQATFNDVLCAQAGVDMFEYIHDIENITGKRIQLIWNDNNFGEFVIETVQISANIDNIQTFGGVAASYSLTEDYFVRELLSTRVSTL